MKKIPTLFRRDFENRGAIADEIQEGCEWVSKGEGIATIKLDGTCCLVRDGKFYKRYELKQGKRAPMDFEPACEFDEATGKQQGWVPVGDGPEDSYHREGFDWRFEKYGKVDDGTYELIGPKVQGNPECVAQHMLYRHGTWVVEDVPTSFNELREWLRLNNGMEGIVWHHPDGRMAKIKLRDFGIERTRGVE